MKKRITILIAASFAFMSCGTALYTSSGQKFSDGIYSMPVAENKLETAESQKETEELIEKTRNSRIFLSSETSDKQRTDTLLIPEDKSAIISFSGTGTTVTVTDDPFDYVYFNTYPWSYHRPVVFSSYRWDPWYYGRYWGYYDPWYWDPWYSYSPWHFGFGFYYDPWYWDPWYWGMSYHPWHHHYCGWYGGWGPGFGGPGHVHGGYGRDVYFGHRSATGFSGSTSSGRPRNSAYTSSGSRTSSRTPAPNRTGIASSSHRSSSSAASSTVTRGSTGSSFGYSSVRRPSTGTGTGTGTRTGIVSTARPSSGQASGNQSAAVSGARRSVHSFSNTVSGTSRSSTKSYMSTGQTNYRRPANTGYNSTRSTSSYSRSSAYGNSGNRSSATDYNRSSSVSRSSSYSRSSSMSSSSSSVSRSSSYSGGSTRSSSSGGGSSVRRR